MITDRTNGANPKRSILFVSFRPILWAAIVYVTGYILLMIRWVPAYDSRGNKAFWSSYRFDLFETLESTTTIAGRVTFWNYVFYPLDVAYYRRGRPARPGHGTPRDAVLDAAKGGDLQKVEAMLKGDPHLVHGTDIHGCTPLHLTAEYGHKDVAELLLANKADVNARDNIGRTPLYKAAMYDHRDVLELLLANKADVNAKSKYGTTPLHTAALSGYADLVSVLLTNKADINAKDNEGETPLHMALGNDHQDVAELLRQHGGRE